VASIPFSNLNENEFHSCSKGSGLSNSIPFTGDYLVRETLDVRVIHSQHEDLELSLSSNPFEFRLLPRGVACPYNRCLARMECRAKT
jgi:hypothetical protein